MIPKEKLKCFCKKNIYLNQRLQEMNLAGCICEPRHSNVTQHNLGEVDCHFSKNGLLFI